MREGKNLQVQIYYGWSPPFSGLIQGDAAAWDEDEERFAVAAELDRQKVARGGK